MSVIIKKNRFYIFLFIILISCTSYYNKKKLDAITQLQTTTNEDYKSLNLLAEDDIANTLKIAKLNLLKIEEKKLDSITMELIYFQYKAYLDCVNKIYEGSQEINALNTILATNSKQLEHIKADYKYSRSKRDDLNKYLLEESNIVAETSVKIKSLINELEKQIIEFNSVNKKMELLIN